nr:1-deoxy-D-xylulose-5-phosphate synthase N-terminal domain-containing protein [Streptomyces sp. ET3-23]
MSGYCCRAESDHDWVENSHASTALSYADGLAKACQLAGEQDRAVVAVIGDGALTGGMAREALDNIASAPGLPVIVVLNDNGRSYAPTTGALARSLAVLRTASQTTVRMCLRSTGWLMSDRSTGTTFLPRKRLCTGRARCVGQWWCTW